MREQQVGGGLTVYLAQGIRDVFAAAAKVEWGKVGFFEYAENGSDWPRSRWAGIPFSLARTEDEKWTTEPAGIWGRDICYVVRVSCRDGGSSREFIWPSQGYCEAPRAGEPGAGLYGFLDGAGWWELPMLGMGYADSFQVLTVRCADIHISDDRAECAVARAWVKHNGSLSQILQALDAEGTPYSAAVSARVCAGIERVCAALSAGIDATSVEMLCDLSRELAAYRAARPLST